MRRSRQRSISLRDAEQLRTASRRARFRVTTINWIHATTRGAPNRHRVIHTVYEWTFSHLLRRIRDLAELSEEIVAIEPLSGSVPRSPGASEPE